MVARTGASVSGTGRRSNVRLLPAFDAFLLAYRNRDFTSSPGWPAWVNSGGGIVKPVLDGREGLEKGQTQSLWWGHSTGCRRESKPPLRRRPGTPAAFRSRR